MRLFIRRSLILGTCFAATLGWSGCEGKKATEYVTGISTQVQVPRDLKAVRVEVSVGGVPQFCRGYKVYDGRVQLPRSLGTFAQTEGAIVQGPITYTIAGVSPSADGEVDIDSTFFGSCTLARVKADNVRVLRRSRQPYIRDEILFLPLPLKFSCYDKDCGSEELTCKGGKCVSATTLGDQANAEDALKKFPRFTPDLLDGTQDSTCFNAELCMAQAHFVGAAGAQIVDQNDCTYAVPNTGSAPEVKKLDPSLPPPPFAPSLGGEGTNVEIVYDGGLVTEVLDIDPEEGFTNPDPAKPQIFRLAPGLCEMVKGVDGEGKATSHRITDVRASGACRAKSIGQPLCAKDQLKAMGVDENGVAKTNDAICSVAELKAPPSGLMMVVDNTTGHQKFFDPEALATLEFPLSDPAFATTQFGLLYTPGPGDGCGVTTPPSIDFKEAGQAKVDILGSFSGYATNPATLNPAANVKFEGALASAYTALKNRNDFFRRAVIVIGDRQWNPSKGDGVLGCTTPLDQNPASIAQAARLDPLKPVETYALQLATAPGLNPEDPPEQGLNDLALAGSDNPITPDARKDKKNAKAAFQKIVNRLATCVYDVDGAADKSPPDTGDYVAFQHPLSGEKVQHKYNATCDKDGIGGEGFGYEPANASIPEGRKRIHLCQNTCDKYRKALEDTSNFALLYQQKQVAVPIFAYKKACLTAPEGAGGDGSGSGAGP